MSSAWMWTDAFLQRQLEALRTAINGDGNWTVHLYTNNHTPAAGDTIADYTEATFTGYAAVNVNANTFGSVTVVSHVAQTVSSVTAGFTMTSGSPVTVYGYYLVDASSNFIGAEMFASSLTITPGGTINVTPEMKQAIYPP